MKEYALYRGDNLLGIGTTKKLEKEFGISRKYLWWLQSPSSQRRYKGKGYMVVKV